MFKLPRYARLWALAGCLGVVGHGQALAGQTCPMVGFSLIEPGASAGTRTVKGPTGAALQVRRDALTTTQDIAEVNLGGNDIDALLLVKFRPDAEARLIAATTGHPGLRLAFVADDEALLAVTWEGPYGLDPGGVQVSLQGNPDRARSLVAAIQTCAGPAR